MSEPSDWDRLHLAAHHERTQLRALDHRPACFEAREDLPELFARAIQQNADLRDMLSAMTNVFESALVIIRSGGHDLDFEEAELFIRTAKRLMR